MFWPLEENQFRAFQKIANFTQLPHYRGPVRGGAHVLRLNFTASYVAISEHSCVACRNFINKF